MSSKQEVKNKMKNLMSNASLSKDFKKIHKKPKLVDQSMSNLIGNFNQNKHLNMEKEYNQLRSKILVVMNQQMEQRKQQNENFLQKLSELLKHLEADYNAMKENEAKLEHIIKNFIKCMTQTIAAFQEKHDNVKDIISSFKTESDEIEMTNKKQADTFLDELKVDFENLENKLRAQAKRNNLENLRKTIMQAMEEDSS